MRTKPPLPTTPSEASPPSANLKRRRFLLALGAGSAASATAATQAITPTAAESPAEAAKKAGYRETQHVRDYYASTRI